MANKLCINNYREIANLRRLDHDSVVALKDVVYKRGEGGRCSIILVFDYFEHDLFGLMANGLKFELKQVKYIFQKIVKGVAHMHSRFTTHRDIKSFPTRRERPAQQQGRC